MVSADARGRWIGPSPGKEELAVDGIRSTRIRSFDSYWHAVRAGRGLPAKRDIDPSEIKPSLPYLSIVEIHEQPLRVRYRLVGTELCRIYDDDFTGRWLHETGWGPLVTQYESLYRSVVTRRVPAFGVGQIEWDGRKLTYEWGKWPLSNDGITVTHCIGIEDLFHLPSGGPRMLR